uniref:Uncharacterized protein n=1 Tax=Avena sativa TaxID=4498 RepID=A0ACD5URG3_AVESA
MFFSRVGLRHSVDSYPLQPYQRAQTNLIWKEKKVVVRWRRLRGPSGQGVQRPVILPPLEAGSCRCSVKPASRCACHIMDSEAQLSHRPQQSTTQLGTGGPAIAHLIQARSATTTSKHHLIAPTRVTSSRYRARRTEVVEKGI